MMEFDSLPADGTAQVNPDLEAPKAAKPVMFDDLQADAPASNAGVVGLNFDDLNDDKEKYSTLGQQVLAGVEGLAQGVAGPLATGLEEGLSKLGVPGISAEERKGREEENPLIHGGAEAVGFGASMLTGIGEAALLAKAGDVAARGAMQALTKGAAKSAAESIGARIAAGGARMMTEMAIFQAGDEATKVINDVPTTPGQVISNIGLSGLLGGVAGAPLAGLGMAVKGAINSQLLRDFTDRLAFRGSNVNVNEKLMHEFEHAQSLYHEMGSEVAGVSGVRAQAMEKLVPEVNEHIVGQAQELASRIGKTVEKLEKTGDKSGMVEQLRRQAERIESSLNTQVDPLTMQPKVAVKSAEVYETLNQVRRQLGEWGKFHKEMVPLNEVAFRNSSKTLGHAVKTALENESVWGKAGTLQKDLNAAWHAAIEPMKDAESKFMTKIAGERVIDPAKFNSYMREGGKATSETTRQQMMGNFIEAVDKFHGATAKAYEAAGMESPFQQASMNALKESLNKQATGAKMADLWYDKLGPKGLSDLAGSGIGVAAGHATGVPGAELAGAVIGKEVLSPAFNSIIKPMMEKGASMPAFQSSMAYVKAVLQGEHQLTNAAANVFGAEVKTLPAKFYPDEKTLNKLDSHLKDVAENPNKMLDIAKGVETYMPDHAQATAKSAMTAVNYLNTLRPTNPKANPLDSELPVSPAQKATYFRALAIAEQPLVALEHVKNGTLLPQDVQTLKTIYPEYYGKMSQKIVTAMTDSMAKGKAVPYHVRQSASLFLGQPLDSTLTPQSIQAIQATYAKNQPMPQQASGNVKRGTSKMGKISEQMLTPEQARQQRANA